MMRFSCLFVFALLLVGCTGGGGGSGELDDELSTLAARYQIVDLETGAVALAGSVDDLATNPAYRDTHIVFRRLEVSGVVGTPEGSIGAGVDRGRRSVQVGPIYLAVFELTQAQWSRIAETEPWTLLNPAVSDDVVVATDHPVVGVSLEDARETFANFSAGVSFSLRLPRDDEWEVACRAGKKGLFAWGEANDTGTVAGYARVRETVEDDRGADAVGMRRANAYGFFDMHGNVAELTRDGSVRGGSWVSTVLEVRSAAAISIGSETAHVLVGVRPVFLP